MPTCRQYLSYSREWRDMAHSHIYLSVPLLVCVDKVNRFSFAFRCSSTTVQPTKQIQSLLVLRPRNIVSVAVAATAPPLLLLLDPVVVVYGYSTPSDQSEWESRGHSYSYAHNTIQQNQCHPSCSFCAT